MQNVYNDVAQIRLPIKRRPCLVIPIISSGVHNHSAIPCEDAHTHLSIETYKYTVLYLYLQTEYTSECFFLQTTRWIGVCRIRQGKISQNDISFEVSRGIPGWLPWVCVFCTIFTSAKIPLGAHSALIWPYLRLSKCSGGCDGWNLNALLEEGVAMATHDAPVLHRFMIFTLELRSAMIIMINQLSWT